MVKDKEYFGKQLVDNRLMNSGVEVDAFEEAVIALCDIPSLENIALFVQAFDDNCEAYDVMFGLVHALEAQDSAEVRTEEYVEQLLLAVPLFTAAASEWAEVVFLRMLNSEQHHQILKQKLGSTSQEIKAKVRTIVENIYQRDPQRFEIKCNFLLEEL
ncbi:MAG: immunity 30 family protein [Flavobacteriaceae bacterium]|jgi:hypothetical protein|nr:immunity 30 family protein [Flavobacteriaceae bacterium]